MPPRLCSLASTSTTPSYYGHELNFAGSEEEGVPAASLTKAEALAAVEDVISSGNFQLVEDYKNLR